MKKGLLLLSAIIVSLTAFGISKHQPEIKKAYKEALLRYCKLDTLAMVIIWEHWRNLR